MRISDWSSDVCSSDLVGDAVTSRRQGLEELRGRLNSSTSAAERADMSARLQLEQAQMMNDQMGLQAIELQRRAKAEANYQRSLASNRSEEHTSELQSLMRISNAVFCLKKKNTATSIH